MPLQYMRLGSQVLYSIASVDIAAIVQAGYKGNPLKQGDLVPLIVTAVISPLCVNGQLVLDGPGGLHWVNARMSGSEPSQWRFPDLLG